MKSYPWLLLVRYFFNMHGFCYKAWPSSCHAMINGHVAWWMDTWKKKLKSKHEEERRLYEGKKMKESGRMTHACKRPPTTTIRNIWLFYIRLLLRPFAIHIISQLQTLQQRTKSTKSKTTKYELAILGTIEETSGQGRPCPDVLIVG